MRSLAIITARGGSKRIPHKNIKEFCGKPILCYTVEAALASGIFEEVMVSTDDEEIARIAREAGAEVPFFRSEETANDQATTADVLAEVLREYEKRGRQFETACCLYPTAPFLTPERLRQAGETFASSGADTLMPVVAFSFPPQRGVFLRDGKICPAHPECMQMRSQDLEKLYHDCGQFYFFRTKALLKTGKLIGDSTAAIILDETEVQDIDTMTDWEIAETKYHYLHRQQEAGEQ